MVTMKKVAQVLERGFTNIGRSRAREHLLRQSDRVLADAGFSRVLLENGNDAWPWQDKNMATDTRSIAAVRRAPAGATSAGVVPFPDSTHLEVAMSTKNDCLKAA